MAAISARLFRAALGELATAGEPVNRVLEVDLDGEDVTPHGLRSSAAGALSRCAA